MRAGVGKVRLLVPTAFSGAFAFLIPRSPLRRSSRAETQAPGLIGVLALSVPIRCPRRKKKTKTGRYPHEEQQIFNWSGERSRDDGFPATGPRLISGRPAPKRQLWLVFRDRTPETTGSSFQGLTTWDGEGGKWEPGVEKQGYAARKRTGKSKPPVRRIVLAFPPRISNLEIAPSSHGESEGPGEPFTSMSREFRLAGLQDYKLSRRVSFPTDPADPQSFPSLSVIHICIPVRLREKLIAVSVAFFRCRALT
ncbi:hypothetical protein B0J18DRAFT_136065 [Chaetomium sp. MPI-SDFR-AT-0129]|nr:hypothetical protein B0J18DRAFT_136065 [Chaetomium sp. MPI-SDFR-AT-0129]